MGRTNAGSRTDGEIPRLQVLARHAHVGARLFTMTDGDGVALDRHALLHHHGVGALGHHRPGHDAYALPFADGPGEGLAGEGNAQHVERAFPFARKVAAPERESVHGGIGVVLPRR